MKLCLIIAEEEDVRTNACRMAEEMGFLCAGADSESYAYVACQALMPDMIVMDGSVTTMDGPEFIRKIKELRRSKRTVILDLDEFIGRFAQREQIPSRSGNLGH